MFNNPLMRGPAARVRLQVWPTLVDPSLTHRCMLTILDSSLQVWLTVPSKCADFVGQAVKVGFEFHHAKPGYVQLTMWLPSTPSPLPRYGFTQIGVGGVVVNSKGEVRLLWGFFLVLGVLGGFRGLVVVVVVFNCFFGGGYRLAS